jgi:hypothetical protein
MKCLPNLIHHFRFSNKFHLSTFLETFMLTFLPEFAKDRKIVTQRSTNGIKMGQELNPSYWVLIKGENCLLSQELFKPSLLGYSLYHVRPCRHTSVLRPTQRPGTDELPLILSIHWVPIGKALCCSCYRHGGRAQYLLQRRYKGVCC